MATQVLVATKETQGQRRNDFSNTHEGEFLIFSLECDRKTVDGHCGCRRSLCGIGSLKATTTFKVTTLEDVTEQGLVSRLSAHFVKDWSMGPTEAAKLAQDDVQDLLKLAASFPLGAVIERRGKTYQTRLAA